MPPDSLAPPSEPSLSSSLHPSLAAALGCLDIRLEDEMARYERSRSQQAVPSPPTPQSYVSETATASSTSAEMAQPAAQPEANLGEFTQVPRAPDLTDDVDSFNSEAPHNGTPSDFDADSIPDDYLASSEQLLRNLAAEAESGAIDDEPVARPWYRHLVTPLGVGAVLITIVSGGLLGLLLVTSGSLDRWLKPDSRQGDRATDESSQTPEAIDIPVELETETPPQSAPEDGFIDINNLATLPNVVANPERATETPVPPPEDADFYYVVVEYSSDRTLAATRAIVPDAYVVEYPAGVKIQAGAFERQEDADRFANLLQQQGIEAGVYPPN